MTNDQNDAKRHPEHIRYAQCKPCGELVESIREGSRDPSVAPLLAGLPQDDNKVVNLEFV